MSKPDWQLSEPQTKIFGLLEFLADEGASKESVLFTTAPGCEPIETLGLIESAEQTGLLISHPGNRRVGSQPPVMLTARGSEEVQRVRDLRRSKVARNQAARTALLLWMYEADGPITTVKNFPFGSVLYYGEQFAVGEIVGAGSYLRDRHLVTGTLQANGTLVTATITAQGREVVEEDQGDPVTSRRRHESYNQIVYGNISGQIAQGANVTQQQTNSLDPELVTALIGAVRRCVQQLPQSEDRADVELALDELKTESASAPADQVRQRFRIFKRVTESAVTAAGAQAGTQVAEELPNLVEQLGSALGL